MYIHVCTFVHTFVFWVLSGPTHPLLYKSTLYTFVFWEKIRPPTPKKNSKKFEELFKKNWKTFKNFSTKIGKIFDFFPPNLTYFLQFFGNFYENFVQKYQLYFCDFGKNVDTHPWLYKSTLYTFVFWVPSGPTPPHTCPVLLYSPPRCHRPPGFKTHISLLDQLQYLPFRNFSFYKVTKYNHTHTFPEFQVAAMEALYKEQTGETVSFSQQYFVDCSSDSNGCAGGSINDGYKLTMMRQYLMSQDDWPYTAYYQACQFADDIATFKNNALQKLWVTSFVKRNQDDNGMVSGLLYSPVAFGSYVSNDIFDYSG